MMADFLYDELIRIGQSVIIGVTLACAYDFLRIIRIMVKHNTIAFSTEDLLFFICAIFPVFYCLLKINDGIFRAYLVFGIIMGFFIYRETVSRIVMWIFGGIAGKIRKITTKLLKKRRTTDTLKGDVTNNKKGRWHNEKNKS